MDDSAPGLPPEVLAHYREEVNEAIRLTRGIPRLEAVRTWDILLRWLPPPPGDVLDIGGAAGIHALWLARKGYRVRLLDAVPEHVQKARAASMQHPAYPIKEMVLGDARDLPFASDAAAAALLLGPLYHLTDREERITALRETARCLVPGGRVFAAAISRFASALDGIARGYLHDEDFEAIVSRDLEDGQHRNPTGRPAWFTTAFFHRPEELIGEIDEAGLTPLALLAVEGPAWIAGDFDSHWDDPIRQQRLLDLLRRIEHEPSLMGASAHFLAVAEKPAKKPRRPRSKA